MPRVIIRPHTAVFTLLLILTDKSLLSLIPLLAALVHEMGHIAVILVLGHGVDTVEITLFGAEIRMPARLGSAAHSAAVYFAGSAANILCGIASLFWLHGVAAELFAVCCFGLATVNLLPIRSLDGGCILEALLGVVSPMRATVIADIVSGITLTLLWLLASYLLLVFGGNLSLMLFCIYLFVTLYTA